MKILRAKRLSVPLLIALLAAPLQALKQPDAPAPADGRAPLRARVKLRRPPLDINTPRTLDSLRAVSATGRDPKLQAILSAWADAHEHLGPAAKLYIDPRTGGPLAVDPDGLPWIPGTGVNNRLTRADMAPFQSGLGVADFAADPPDGDGVNQAVLERIARKFMADHPAWFPVPASQLVRAEADFEPGHYVRSISFAQVVDGVPVDDARLVFMLNHGNLVSFGGQNLAPVAIPVLPRVTGRGAQAAAFAHAGVNAEQLAAYSEPQLRIVIADDGPGRALGGLAHRLIWAVAMVAPGDDATWEAEVDALTGDVIGFRDTNKYGQIVGGVYPNSNDGLCPTGCLQANYPMPYADYTNIACPATGATTTVTDTGGNYPNSYAGTVNTKLCGQYVRINDNCGAISSAATTQPNNVNLGGAAGTDCALPAPNNGGAGNTNSSRTAFYNVNKLKEMVRGWRPSWTFNNNRVTVNVNINNVCNAFWGGTGTLNMYRDNGGSCRNTGEIAMIFDHELGHGYDANDGGGGSNPGEAYADDAAFILHHDSCIGRGFTKTGTCGGYGDVCTTCSGVREQDWTRHVGTGTRAAPNPIPHTIADGQSPGGFYCTTTDADICGFETHCAAYPISESLWDAAVIDLPHNPIPANGGAACAGTSPGNPVTQSQAWTLVSKLFWLSTPTLGAQYTCVTNGTAGCDTTSLFKQLKIQDDSDGNLANGTPHAAELQCAFARHQTGCTTDNNTDQLVCPVIGTPSLTVTPGNGQNVLNWTAAAGANQYRVLRNEEGCGAGYTVIATVSSATLTYTNTGLQTGRTYFYQVQAIGTSAACEGAPSSCATGKPYLYSVPTLTSAAPGAANQAVLNFAGGAQPAPRYKVYRDRNSCANADFSVVGNFAPVPLATGVTASPYNDNGIPGAGLVYAYAVSGSGTDGLNETARSNCLEVTPTGTCTIAPLFSGVSAAGNTAGATCGVALSWSAGSAICGTGGLTYNVYRSTSPGFTPSAANRIASGVAGTGYTDTAGLTYNTTYYYMVRAVDSAGNEEANVVQVSDKPTGAITVHYNETFEAATAWAHQATGSTATTGAWIVGDPAGTNYQPEDDHTAGAGTRCFYTAANPGGGDGTDDVDGGLVNGTSGVINTAAVPPASGVLEFWYFNGLSVANAANYFRVDLSSDGGTSYPTNIINNNNTTRGNAWTRYSAPLTIFNANFRMRLQAQDSTGSIVEGGIDDVKIYSSLACSCGPAVMSTVTQGKAGANLTVNWSAPVGAASYSVYRNAGSPANPGTWASAATGVTALTWTDANQLSNGTSQFYTVTTVNGCGAESSR